MPAAGGSTTSSPSCSRTSWWRLGATAARGVMHKSLTINANRGRLIELPEQRHAVITVHPSYLLRLLEERDKRREFDRLVKDLRFAADAARRS